MAHIITIPREPPWTWRQFWRAYEKDYTHCEGGELTLRVCSACRGKLSVSVLRSGPTLVITCERCLVVIRYFALQEGQADG